MNPLGEHAGYGITDYTEFTVAKAVEPVLRNGQLQNFALRKTGIHAAHQSTKQPMRNCYGWSTYIRDPVLCPGARSIEALSVRWLFDEVDLDKA